MPKSRRTPPPSPMPDAVRAWLRAVVDGPLPERAPESQDTRWNRLIDEIRVPLEHARDGVASVPTHLIGSRRQVYQQAGRLADAEAANLCQWHADHPDETAVALDAFLSALAFGRAMSALVATFAVDSMVIGTRARANARDKARARAKKIRDEAHPRLVEAMENQRQKKRPLSFHAAAVVVSRAETKPGGKGFYSVRTIERVAMRAGVHW